MSLILDILSATTGENSPVPRKYRLLRNMWPPPWACAEAPNSRRGWKMIGWYNPTPYCRRTAVQRRFNNYGLNPVHEHKYIKQCNKYKGKSRRIPSKIQHFAKNVGGLWSRLPPFILGFCFFLFCIAQTFLDHCFMLSDVTELPLKTRHQ